MKRYILHSLIVLLTFILGLMARQVFPSYSVRRATESVAQTLLENREKAGHRVLTETEYEGLRESLLQVAPSKVPIEIVTQDHSFPETVTSEALAEQLADLFKELGWEVSLKHSKIVPQAGTICQTLSTKPMTASEYPAAADALINWLMKSRIRAADGQNIDPSHDHFAVRITIGVVPTGRLVMDRGLGPVEKQ